MYGNWWGYIGGKLKFAVSLSCSCSPTLLFMYVGVGIVLCNGGELESGDNNEESLLHKRGWFSSYLVDLSNGRLDWRRLRGLEVFL